jgi:hypothetical protein
MRSDSFQAMSKGGCRDPSRKLPWTAELFNCGGASLVHDRTGECCSAAGRQVRPLLYFAIER